MLKNFEKYYDLSTGLCSVKYWTNVIEKNIFQLVEAIHSELYDSYAFDFEVNCDELIKKFRHMSLFSVCLQFLRCKVCSRVRENAFYEHNAFPSLKVRHADVYLNISSSERIDLDVFLSLLIFLIIKLNRQSVSVQILKLSVLLEIYLLPFVLLL